jgi:class 3 adenylate cyclase/tetratricopeptide (TPR) repeat protein
MTESPIVYIPMDRRQALARGESLPDRVQGAALFADISGSTPLTELLARELGPQRGSEEITRHLNLVYDAIIAELHRFGGSVIGFSGDAITCWFDEDTGLRAAASGLAMQQAMQRFAHVTVPSGTTMPLTMKVAIAVGPARRFLVGASDAPRSWLIEVLAGRTLDRLARVEKNAAGGEVVLDETTARALDDHVSVASWRAATDSPERYAVIDAVNTAVDPAPWPALPEGAVTDTMARPWLLPAVYARLRSGLGEFLAELRPAVCLFMYFGGLDYDQDDEAGGKLDVFIRQVQGILGQYDGTLIQLTIGDKGSYFYAAFGAPAAHEDDAQRAASAALALRELAQHSGSLGIAAFKIGLAQGRMRTGAYGSTTQRTYGVLGNAANMAARLMQIASPGQILATTEAYERAANDFVWEQLPPVKVKGRSEPLPCFSLESTKAQPAVRLRETQHVLPLVGRAAELTLIGQALDEASKGQGRIISLKAEAGMGKSRLAAEIVRMARERQWPVYGGECQSFGVNTSYHVWHSIWWHFFGLSHDWPPERQMSAVAAQLGELNPDLLPRLPLLGAALNLSIPDNELTASFDSKLRKTSLEALLVECLRARCQFTPLVLLFEDCHWLDPLSQDLLTEIARATADLAQTLVLAYRPPFLSHVTVERINNLPHTVNIELANLSPSETQQLIGHKLAQTYGGGAQASAPLAERIGQRAGGNPFFVEELLNYLRSQDIDPNDAEALAKLDLPVSLHSLILSRVDQLPESPKITLRVASIVGRSFEPETLSGYYPALGEDQRVREDLKELTAADLTMQEAADPHPLYGFRHVLTQEVAYESLPFATRALLHESLAQFIERTAGDRIDQYIDQLALHYGRSNNEAKKREYFLKAGDRARAAYNNAAAIDYYQQALPLVEGAEHITLSLKLAQVLDLMGRQQDAHDLLAQTVQNAERLQDPQALARCQTVMGEHLRKRGLYKEAAIWLERARAGFDAIGDVAGVGQVLHFQGTLTAQQGDYARAQRLYEDSLEVRRQLGDQVNIASLLSNLGNVARLQGRYHDARALHGEGLRIRESLGDKWGIAVSLNNLGNVARNQGDYAEARQRLEQALTLQRAVGDRSMIVNALNDLGNVVRDQADYGAAARFYGEALQINQVLDNPWALAHLLEDVGCLAAMQDMPRRALHLVGAAAMLRDTIGAPLSPTEQAKLEERLAFSTHRLDAIARADAVAAGRVLTKDQAIKLAREIHETER